MIIEQQIALLAERLTRPLPGIAAQELMIGRAGKMPAAIPENARPSAVLCLLFPLNGALHLLLMKRGEDNTAHSGQVSFPGGSFEKSDIDLRTTALRETYEEVGIPATEINVLGALTPLYIPVSNFNVYPFVGYAATRPVYNLSHKEVSHIIEVPFSSLLHAETKTVTDVISPAIPGMIRKVNAYKLTDGTIIWGATAMIISELEVIFSNTQ